MRAWAYKMGAWHDVGWWQLALLERADAPAILQPLAAVRTSQRLQQALMPGSAGRALHLPDVAGLFDAGHLPDTEGQQPERDP